MPETEAEIKAKLEAARKAKDDEFERMMDSYVTRKKEAKAKEEPPKKPTDAKGPLDILADFFGIGD